MSAVVFDAESLALALDFAVAFFLRGSPPDGLAVAVVVFNTQRLHVDLD